eukprot:gene13959-17361_t
MRQANCDVGIMMMWLPIFNVIAPSLAAPEEIIAYHSEHLQWGVLQTFVEDVPTLIIGIVAAATNGADRQVLASCAISPEKRQLGAADDQRGHRVLEGVEGAEMAA